MKRWALTMVVLLIAFLATGCTSASAGTSTMTLNAAPWKDGDRLAYDWVDKNGTKVGTAEIGFAKDGNAWVMSHADKLPNLEQLAKVRMDSSGLKPLGGEKTIKAQGTDAKINTTYEGGKLSVKANVGGEEKSAGVDVPANAVDNDQLLQALRALPFAEGYEGKFVNVVSQSAAKVESVARVKGKEKVQVPAGSFDAWKVELDFGQAKQNAWYQVDAPHSLLQYDNGQIKLVLVK